MCKHTSCNDMMCLMFFMRKFGRSCLAGARLPHHYLASLVYSLLWFTPCHWAMLLGYIVVGRLENCLRHMSGNRICFFWLVVTLCIQLSLLHSPHSIAGSRLRLLQKLLAMQIRLNMASNFWQCELIVCMCPSWRHGECVIKWDHSIYLLQNVMYDSLTWGLIKLLQMWLL